MLPVSPARWASYGKPFQTSGSCPTITCKSRDTVEGRLTYWSKDLDATGYTGVLYAVEEPAEWSGDRYNKKYIVQPVTGVLSLTGDTGPYGSYDLFWRINIAGVTGVEHGQYYGLQVSVNPGLSGATGSHYTSDLVIQVKDSFK